MRVINKTCYDTRLLRSVIVAVHNHEKDKRGALRSWDRIRVTVTHSRSSGDAAEPLFVVIGDDRLRRSGFGYTGRATLSGSRMTLCIPKRECRVADLIALVRHELWHSYGLRHRDFTPSVMQCAIDRNILAILGFVQSQGVGSVINEAAELASDSGDDRHRRIENVASLIAKYERRIRLAQSAIKRLSRRRSALVAAGKRIERMAARKA